MDEAEAKTGWFDRTLHGAFGAFVVGVVSMLIASRYVGFSLGAIGGGACIGFAIGFLFGPLAIGILLDHAWY
jgi:hypothetical protein